MTARDIGVNTGDGRHIRREIYHRGAAHRLTPLKFMKRSPPEIDILTADAISGPEMMSSTNPLNADGEKGRPKDVMSVISIWRSCVFTLTQRFLTSWIFRCQGIRRR